MPIKYYDIHRHDQFSLFDGFGTAEQVAARAAELKYKACGSTNHGNITGLVKHFRACAEKDIIPILGCEFYFCPKINKEEAKEKQKYYHLCLYASSLKGWENLNELVTYSNQEEKFYYKPRLDFVGLEKYSEGIVCSSACIAGIISVAILNGKIGKAKKLIEKFKSIYGKRFFLEIQPFEIFEEGAGSGLENKQIKVNEQILQLARETKTPVIVTSDSHFVKKEDFLTYLKMHEIKKSQYGVGYSERYMPSSAEINRRIEKYHPEEMQLIANGMKNFLSVVGDSREWFSFTPHIPQYTNNPQESFELMKKQCIKFLKAQNKFNAEYKARLKTEFEVIKYHGFQDYFLIVQDYVNWARENKIAVGPGRGSAGNSLVNYALGITLVDPLKFGNDFARFLRKDKKKFPDIDCDFGQDRRNEVIDYIVNHYERRAAQTLTYGCYNIKNLINDLAKVCDCNDKQEIEEIKKFLAKYCDDSNSTINSELYETVKYKKYNAMYDNILLHFTKMYGKVRYFGTHASSVILSSDKISGQAGLCRIGGSLRTSFDLHDIEFLGLLKLDILGLSSATQAKELEEMCGEKFSYEMLNNKKAMRMFSHDPTAVFQFEGRGGIELAKVIGVNSFEDIVALVALNRPGPLLLGMPEQYANNKQNPPTNTPWYKYTKQSYGTLIYQEQAMAIAREIGGFNNEDADKIAKYDAKHIPEETAKEYHKIFVKNAVKNGISRNEAENLFNSLLGYSFNRGHAVAYGMLAAELGYFKANYPDEFWYVTLKYEQKEDARARDEALYVKAGGIIFLPHVNGYAKYKLTEYEGDKILVQGTSAIKGVGDIAAAAIEAEKEANGPYKDIDDFTDRLPKKIANARVVSALKAAGALKFNKKAYVDNVLKYNCKLMAR